MLALLKSETRRDFALLSAAMFKFFLVQSILSLLHLFKAMVGDQVILLPFINKVLAIAALVCVVLGAVGAKTHNRQLIFISVLYLGMHALIGIAEDVFSLWSGFSFPKSILNFVTLLLGAFMALFQTYCAALLFAAVKGKDDKKAQ